MHDATYWQTYYQANKSAVIEKAGKWNVANRARVREEVERIKSTTPCADCKTQYPPYVMDFDHVRGDKEFTIGNNGNRSYSRVLAEIEKCDVVCSNCHRERTHGTITPG